MSRQKKLLNRLLSIPKDFTWSEAVALLTSLGYVVHKSSGSGRKFIHKDTNQLIIAHEPHPGDIMKRYAVRDIIDSLKDGGFIDEQ